MDNFQIETAQNVVIKQNVAHLSTRIGAFIIDGLIMASYYILVMVIMAWMDIDIMQGWTYSLLFGLPIFFYSLVFEVLWNGQTPGKRINQIRVVKLDGSNPTLGSFTLRWVLRTIDISLSSGSIAILSILLGGKGQRLGDIAASTTVISEKKKVSLKDTITAEIPQDYIPTFPQVTTLSDSDIQTIKNLYNKSKRTGNHKVILKLYYKVTTLLEIQTDIKPIDFIDIIIKDYNYYTQKMQ